MWDNLLNRLSGAGRPALSDAAPRRPVSAGAEMAQSTLDSFKHVDAALVDSSLSNLSRNPACTAEERAVAEVGLNLARAGGQVDLDFAGSYPDYTQNIQLLALRRLATGVTAPLLPVLAGLTLAAADASVQADRGGVYPSRDPIKRNVLDCGLQSIMTCEALPAQQKAMAKFVMDTVSRTSGDDRGAIQMETNLLHKFERNS